MERKVVVKVEFDFYPSEDESWGDRHSLNDEQLASEVERIIDANLTDMAFDGLWHHIESATVVTFE
jgi:hypothetical protein